MRHLALGFLFAVGVSSAGAESATPGAVLVVNTQDASVSRIDLDSMKEVGRYLASFWVDGYFEMDPVAGKVTRLVHLAPPPGNAAPQEVTYHGVEAIGPDRILAANEGRSYVDSVEPSSGKLLDRLQRDISKPCCIERIPGTTPPRALVSNIGSGTVTLVEIADDGTLTSRGTVTVGAGPKRVAFIPRSANTSR